MNEIIASIIGGFFGLIGIIIQTKKCNNYRDLQETLLVPNQVLTHIYEPPNNPNLDYSKYITSKNGKYKIKVPPQLRMYPSNLVGTVNIFKIFKTNYNTCVFELLLSNIKGRVELFVKRFNNDWGFVDNDPITTIPANKGYNKMIIKSRIGQDNISIEQIGIMIYSSQNINSCLINHCINSYSTCNINSAKITLE